MIYFQVLSADEQKTQSEDEDKDGNKMEEKHLQKGETVLKEESKPELSIQKLTVDVDQKLEDAIIMKTVIDDKKKEASLKGAEKECRKEKMMKNSQVKADNLESQKVLRTCKHLF